MNEEQRFGCRRVDMIPRVKTALSGTKRVTTAVQNSPIGRRN